jgi:hypothetical protein
MRTWYAYNEKGKFLTTWNADYSALATGKLEQPTIALDFIRLQFPAAAYATNNAPAEQKEIDKADRAYARKAQTVLDARFRKAVAWKLGVEPVRVHVSEANGHPSVQVHELTERQAATIAKQQEFLKSRK